MCDVLTKKDIRSKSINNQLLVRITFRSDTFNETKMNKFGLCFKDLKRQEELWQ